ncbi:DNA-directed RNA polymerase II subunit [Neoconidiobolus thromboides FSU 785]|nr:DNA-directed RNA polymerase II subunit [Neoconidiobolus thromboides FSU 785]
MFYLKQLSHTIQLHPSFFGTTLRSQIQEKVHNDVEGKCSGLYGYIICVVSLAEISSGKIIPGNGLAEFDVKYNAIVLKPMKGEVVDAVVASVNSQGFFAMCGPLSIFISKINIPSRFTHDSAGINNCFSFEDQVIGKDTAIRVKIISTRVDANAVVAIGSMLDDYLGVIKR